MLTFKNNQAPVANGVALCATLAPFVSKDTLKAIDAIDAQVSEIVAERAPFLRDRATADFNQLRSDVHTNPTKENREKWMSETPEQFFARYELRAEKLGAIIGTVRATAHTLNAEVLDGLTAALDAEAEKIEKKNAATFAKYGVPYDPTEDAVLKSIARFMDAARARLDNAACVMSGTDLKEFLGELKSKSLFA